MGKVLINVIGSVTVIPLSPCTVHNYRQIFQTPRLQERSFIPRVNQKINSHTRRYKSLTKEPPLIVIISGEFVAK